MKPSPATVVTWPKFNEIEWSQRAQNALANAGITTWRRAYYLEPNEARAIRSAGAKTIREIGGELFKRCLRPRFMSGHWNFNHSKLSPGMVKLAGPFGRGERHMLEAAVGMLNGDVEWAVTTDPLDNTKLWLWRTKDGMKEVDEIEEGE